MTRWRPTVDTITASLPRCETWVYDAPCAGKWWVTDLPSWMPPSAARRHIITAMTPALELCASCPFTRECFERTQPTVSWFDGVCAGVVYRNGNPIGGLTTARAAA